MRYINKAHNITKSYIWRYIYMTVLARSCRTDQISTYKYVLYCRCIIKNKQSSNARPDDNFRNSSSWHLTFQVYECVSCWPGLTQKWSNTDKHPKLQYFVIFYIAVVVIKYFLTFFWRQWKIWLFLNPFQGIRNINPFTSKGMFNIVYHMKIESISCLIC